MQATHTSSKLAGKGGRGSFVTPAVVAHAGRAVAADALCEGWKGEEGLRIVWVSRAVSRERAGRAIQREHGDSVQTLDGPDPRCETPGLTT